MNTADIVFAALFALTIIFLIGWEMISYSLVTGHWIGFRRLALLCGAFALGAFLLFALPKNPLVRGVGWVLPIGALLYTVASVGVELFGKRGRRKQTRDHLGDEKSVWENKIILVILLLALVFAVFLYWFLFQQYGGTGLFIEFILGFTFALIVLGVFLVILFKRQRPGE